MNVLLVSQCEWGDHLGQSKVHFDLKKEYEKLGCKVDTLTWEDIYPNGVDFLQKIFEPVFTKKYQKILQKIARKYDVIDSNHECIPYPKESFNFNGLLMYRSHGLQALYETAESIPSYKKALEEANKITTFKTRLGNIYRSIQTYRKITNQFFDDAIHNSDIVHCLNTTEYMYHLRNGIDERKLRILPNGLPDNTIFDLNKISSVNKGKVISFIGSWSIRKGIKDLNTILSIIKSNSECERVQILGGGVDTATIKNDFDSVFHSYLEIVPRYKQTELSRLLSHTKVGVFPSYAEGFGLAIVEQLACGIPVVAYNVPGPSDILNTIDSSLLIEPGDTATFGGKVASILKMDDVDYLKLAEKCKQRSNDFLISGIALSFFNMFKSFNK